MLLLVALPWSTPAIAYRPFDSTDADIAGKGEVEVEMGPMGYLAEGSERFLVVPRLILNWGFVANWEAVLEGSHQVLLDDQPGEQRQRIEDTGLSFKGMLRNGTLQEELGPSFATEIGFLLPTLHGERGAGASAALILSQRWKAAALHLNGAAVLTRSHQPGYFAGAILEGPAAWRVRPVGETFLEDARDRSRIESALVGAIGRVREGLSIDAAVRTARSGGESIHEARAGLTWDFPARRAP